jgi:hypothetical protein
MHCGKKSITFFFNLPGRFVSWLQSVLGVNAPMVHLRLIGVGALIAPQASPYGISGEQFGSDSPKDFRHNTSVFPCQYHSTTAPHSYSFTVHRRYLT